MPASGVSMGAGLHSALFSVWVLRGSSSKRFSSASIAACFVSLSSNPIVFWRMSRSDARISSEVAVF
ncbi:hypothetical protein DPMN_042827 [Dreissena polymorpha]|uniref:Uncharacterized protein n=1 Tax=Dreissena polymorpha TaxID=45954 RepID=A0A9D4D1Q7_DREPO|nr:hypothetical protein DPMN_042827 [Dreissena polymorpha]